MSTGALRDGIQRKSLGRVDKADWVASLSSPSPISNNETLVSPDCVNDFINVFLYFEGSAYAQDDGTGEITRRIL